MDAAPGHLALREVPVHALMIAVMAMTMVAHSALASVVGAGVLVAASVVCAALSRTRAFLREHVVDLWAMALVLLAFLPAGRVAGHHALQLSSVGAFTVVVLAWGGARGWLVLQHRGSWRVPVASAAVTAAGLALMALLCA